jgi:hypothetical protein
LVSNIENMFGIGSYYGKILTESNTEFVFLNVWGRRYSAVEKN